MLSSEFQALAGKHFPELTLEDYQKLEDFSVELIRKICIILDHHLRTVDVLDVLDHINEDLGTTLTLGSLHD